MTIAAPAAEAGEQTTHCHKSEHAARAGKTAGLKRVVLARGRWGRGGRRRVRASVRGRRRRGGHWRRGREGAGRVRRPRASMGATLTRPPSPPLLLGAAPERCLVLGSGDDGTCDLSRICYCLFCIIGIYAWFVFDVEMLDGLVVVGKSVDVCCFVVELEMGCVFSVVIVNGLNDGGFGNVSQVCFIRKMIIAGTCL